MRKININNPEELKKFKMETSGFGINNEALFTEEELKEHINKYFESKS